MHTIVLFTFYFLDLVEMALFKNSFDLDKIVCLVRDDGTNFVKACRIMEIDRFLFYFTQNIISVAIF